MKTLRSHSRFLLLVSLVGLGAVAQRDDPVLAAGGHLRHRRQDRLEDLFVLVGERMVAEVGIGVGREASLERAAFRQPGAQHGVDARSAFA